MPEPRLAPVQQLKVPPHSLEAEQSVLGGLLLSSTAWDQVGDKITEDDFYREDHRIIFRAIQELRENNQPADAVTVTEWFESNGQADLVAGGAYILELSNATPSAANVLAYAEIVREKSILRSLIEVGTEVAAGGYASDGRDSKELLEQAEQLIFRIADRGNRRGPGFVSIQETITAAMERIQDLYEVEEDITGGTHGL